MDAYTHDVTPLPLFCMVGPEGHDRTLFIDTDYIIESCAATTEQATLACRIIAAVLDRCRICAPQLAHEAAATPCMPEAMDRLLVRAAFRCGVTAVDFADGIDLHAPSIDGRADALIALALQWEPFIRKMTLCGAACRTCQRLGSRWQDWLGTHQQ